MLTKKSKPKLKTNKKKAGKGLAEDAFTAGVKLALKNPRVVSSAIAVAGPAAYYGLYRAGKAIHNKLKK